MHPLATQMMGQYQKNQLRWVLVSAQTLEKRLHHEQQSIEMVSFVLVSLSCVIWATSFQQMEFNHADPNKVYIVQA